MGCASAFYAAKSGLKVAVVEKNALPGRETTARSGAIIRAHYGVPELVEISIEANHRFANWAEEIGGDAGFTRCGYSVLVDENDAQTLRKNVEMHQKLGAKVSLLSPDELKALVSNLKIHDANLAALESDGGFALPAQTIRSLHENATKLGAQFFFDSLVVGAKKCGKSHEISLQNGETVFAHQIGICTGNWSREVGKLFDLELPVVPVRAQIAVLERPASFRGSFPVVSDLINLAYFRMDGEAAMWIGSSDMSDLQEQLNAPENFNENADENALESAKMKAKRRFEGLENAQIARSFCGLYEATPDWQPIIDSFENVHVAVGFSGHGFKLAPVIGEEMAHRARGEKSPFPTQIFDLARFGENRPIKSRHVYQRARFLR